MDKKSLLHASRIYVIESNMLFFIVLDTKLMSIPMLENNSIGIRCWNKLLNITILPLFI